MPEAFHFLRPAWLLVSIPTALLYVVILRASSERQWRRVIAPHLLSHLKVGGEGGFRFEPIQLTTLFLALGSLALAGPTWERERSPFAEDTAPLVVALDLSQSMNAIDVQPTRLERAKQKIRDLLELRKGSRTALVAYAGTAHIVLPLSSDTSIFETFLSSLATNVMPVAGKDPVKALEVADELLSRDEVAGSILFFTDGIARDQVPAFVAHRARSDDVVMVLAVGTREGGPVRRGENTFVADADGRRIVATLDIEGLEALVSETGAFVASVTVDDEDVDRVERRIQRNLREANEDDEDETARWRDFGYYLMFPIALFGVLWFRKGWTVRWSVVVLLILPACSTDVWLTPDQQGRRHFERQEFAEAADSFDDPMWRGVASYRAGDFDAAIDAFARLDTAEAYFNLGNSYRRVENYEQAAASYEDALEREPGWVEAEENLAMVRALIPAAPNESPPPGGEPSFSADEVKFDDKADQGTEGEVEMSLLSDDQLSEMWMRRLSTSPADFLRRRFAMEAAPP
jgi:Ca-activated chloride channel family protein